MKKESEAKQYSFPIDIYSLALVAHRLCNLYTGKEKMFKEDNFEVTQENFSIPSHYSKGFSDMLKSWLAPKDVDRPVLAEIAIDPLFKEFITLEPYNDSCRKKCCPVHEGFMVRSDIFAGRKSKPGGDVITGMFQGKDE